MIITLIVTGLVILGIVLAIVATKLGWKGEDLFVAGICLSALFIIILFAIGTCIIKEHALYDTKLAMLQAKREALVYQLENDMYLGDAIGEFNSNILEARGNHENPWTSWFYGDYYMEVEPIELK